MFILSHNTSELTSGHMWFQSPSDHIWGVVKQFNIPPPSDRLPTKIVTCWCVEVLFEWLVYGNER